MTYKFETPRNKYEQLTNAKGFIQGSNKVAPDLYDKDSPDMKAMTFMFSMRGQLIMAKALYYALEFMDTVPDPHKETSDIKDLAFIQQYVFNLPPDLWAENTFHKQELVPDGDCIHVVKDCETDSTCQCGAVVVGCDAFECLSGQVECDCNVPEGGAEQFNC